MHDNDTFDPELDGAMLDLRSAVGPQVRAPGAVAVLRTVRRRRAVRKAVAGALALVTLTVGVSTIALTRHSASHPATTAKPLNTAIRQIDVRNTRLSVPETAGCSAGEVTFIDGEAAVIGADSPTIRWKVGGAPDKSQVQPVYLDVDGDAAEDVLLQLDCGPGQMMDGSVLVAYTLKGDHLALLTLVMSRPARSFGRWGQLEVEKDGVIVVPKVMGAGNYPREWIRLRWSGTGFSQLPPRGRVDDLPFDARQDALLNFPAVPTCPAMADPIPEAPTGSECGWSASSPSGPSGNVVGDLTGDGKPELLMMSVCMHNGNDVGVVVAAVGLDPAGKPYTVGIVSGGAYVEVRQIEIKDGLALVTVRSATGIVTTTRHRWDGAAFVVVP